MNHRQSGQSGKSGRMAFCGVMTALAVLFLLLSAIPITEISLAALAGIVAVPVVIEAGRRAGLFHYIAVALLALLLTPSMEAKALYIAFFGYYSVGKAALESRCLPRPLEWGIKLAVFNGAMITCYWVLLRFAQLETDAFTIGGVSLPWLFLLLGNGVFLLYDWCLTRLIGLYMTRFHARVRHLFRF